MPNGEKTLNKLLNASNNRSTFLNLIKNVGKTFSQVDLLNFYKLAANSLINDELKVYILYLIKENPSNLAKINETVFVSVVILLGYYYGYLRNVFYRKDFLKYTLSMLTALKTSVYIPMIFDNVKRGSITFDAVSNLVNGVMPAKAIKLAFRNYELKSLIRRPRSLNKKRNTRNFKTNNNQSNYNNNQNNYNNFNNINKFKRTCFKCHQIFYNSGAFSAHIRSCKR